MKSPDSLQELPMLKYHMTPGGHRDSLDDYEDLAQVLEAPADD